MKEKRLKYFFDHITECNMCGNPTDQNILLGQRLNTSQGYKPKKKNGISTSIYKCRKCQLIYSNPQPIPFSILDHYGIPAEEYWKPEYFKYDPAYFSSEIKKAKEILPFKNGMKALDIGAGIGKSMISLDKAGFDTYGFEPSDTFRNKAIEKMGIQPDKLKFGMIEEIEYQENQFDFITFGAVLEHLYNPSENIEKALKWLKPQGIIQIEVPSSKHLIATFINFYYRLIGTNYVTNLSPMHEPFHLFEFDLKSFEENAKKLNYEIAYSEYNVCSIYFIPKIFHPLLRWYMKKSNTGMQLTVFLRKL